MDRSPTGTGVSAHLAILAARKSITDQTPYAMESILGTNIYRKDYGAANLSWPSSHCAGSVRASLSHRQTRVCYRF